MLRKIILATIITAWSFSLGGCYLYFEDDDRRSGGYSYCDSTGCYWCDDFGCYPDGDVEPGGDCTTDSECGVGCFCNDQGQCEETAICSDNADCPEGFVCDDRASCIPEGDDPAPDCSNDSECALGEYCDEGFGVCVDSTTCTNSDQCGPGYDCDGRGTCIPTPCANDGQCLEGSYCDNSLNECVVSTSCDEGCGVLTCDISRNTCVPPTHVDEGTCNGVSICTVAPPECAEGETPGIADGCYTGYCIAIDDCPDGPPLTCPDITDELVCFNNPSCEPIYQGINCTDPDGELCTSGDSNCTCESFNFAACVDAQ